ncbi:hypothetical protein FA95DRAFT_1287588 [Auriscalpium vulgare]|uniref:Uncharacterized protein n=1 Tax=Auriscalpium vulgare TaxID=40419 RepID=A0ACB8RSF0_9AGAM|nr:hypothetical protein FA95DRAFT_1287588 [Auriscalpium vulgare]
MALYALGYQLLRCIFLIYVYGSPKVACRPSGDSALLLAIPVCCLCVIIMTASYTKATVSVTVISEIGDSHLNLAQSTAFRSRSALADNAY